MPTSTPTPTPTSTSSRSHARSPLSPLSPFPLNSLRRSLLRRRGRRQRERERERREREQQQGETAVISSLLPPLTTTTTTTTTLVSLQCQTFRLRWIDPKHKECAVCAEDFAVNHIISMLPCGHYFCQPCMDQWFFHRPTVGNRNSNSNHDDDDDDHDDDSNNRLCEVTHTTCPLCRYDCRSDVVPTSSQLYEEHSTTASMVPGAIRLTTDDGPDFSESSESTLDGDHVDIDIDVDIGALVLSPRAWNMNHFNTDDDNGGDDDHNMNNGEQQHRMQRKDDDNGNNVDYSLATASTPSPAIIPPELASTQDNRNLGQNFDLIVNKILRAKKEQQLLQRRQQKQQHQQKQK